MKKVSIEESVDIFLDHIRYLKVKHHVPGRIRVKATWNGVKKLAASSNGDIEQIVAMIPGINGYRVNPKALSAIISYAPEVLPFQLWEEIGKLGEFPLNRSKIKEKLLVILDRVQEEV